jgi:Fe-S cluster assembly iron-binding protein IscA
LKDRARPGTVVGSSPSSDTELPAIHERETHLVLTLTENASTVVKTIVDQSSSADQAGLRISQDAVDSPALHVIATERPLPGDQVLEEDGARVFLEETAAETLEDKVLDAQLDDNGGVQFTISQQTA